MNMWIAVNSFRLYMMQDNVFYLYLVACLGQNSLGDTCVQYYSCVLKFPFIVSSLSIGAIVIIM